MWTYNCFPSSICIYVYIEYDIDTLPTKLIFPSLTYSLINLQPEFSNRCQRTTSHAIFDTRQIYNDTYVLLLLLLLSLLFEIVMQTRVKYTYC